VFEQPVQQQQQQQQQQVIAINPFQALGVSAVKKYGSVTID
jgi:hypothetical protein